MSEIWNLNALCRCCHANGAFKSLQAPYVHDEAIEIYAVLLRDTFGLHINPPTVEASYAICECCIDQLRLAHRFKKQVLVCERKFEEYCKNERTVITTDNVKIEIDNENVILNPDLNDVDDCSAADDSDGGYGDNDSEYGVDSSKSSYGHETEIVFCEICKESFGNIQSKRSHVFEAHVADGLSCRLCQRKFKSRNMLRRHCSAHEKKVWRCNYCVEVLGSRSARERHEYYQHVKLTGYVCDQCLKTFESKESLVRHIDWHSRSNEFVCETCGKAFKKGHALKVHVETVHQNQRAFQCGVCGKAYKAKSALVQHQYSHTGERPHQCSVCTKGFKTKTDLKYHMERHELRGEVEGRGDENVGWDVGGEEDGADDSDGGFDDNGIANESEAEARVQEEVGEGRSQVTGGRKERIIVEEKKIDIEIKPETESKAADEHPVEGVNYSEIKIEFCSADSPNYDGGDDYEDYSNEYQDEEYKDDKNDEAIIKEEPEKKGVKSKSNNVTKGRDNGLPFKSDAPTYTCDFCEEQFACKNKLQDHYSDKHIPDDFSCALCDLPFKGQKSLIKHLMTDHEKKTYFCRFCVETFKSAIALKDHEDSHNNEGYICDYCRKVFKWKLTLMRHVRVHMGNYKEFACETCGHAFRVKANLRRHVAAVHEKIKPFKCDACDKCFALKKSLDDHRRLHTGERPFQCDLCSKGFVSEAIMKKHRLKHGEVREKEGVQCDVCFKYYPSFAIKQHMNSHSKPFKCEMCGQGFGQKAILMRHRNNAHLAVDAVEVKPVSSQSREPGSSRRAERLHKEKRHKAGPKRQGRKPYGKNAAKADKKTFNCSCCIQTFKSSIALSEHESSHTKDGYVCDHCQKAFKWKKTLVRHINWHMGIFKEFVCETCGHVFKLEANLRQHILTVHDKLRPYQCDLCEKTYTQKRHLVVHRRSHTGEKPFLCDVCSKGFASKCKMVAHRQRRHGDKEGMPCDVCGKQFASSAAINQHMHTHTKPFNCELCGQGFSTKALLTRHKKNCHLRGQESVSRGGRRNVCDVCHKPYLNWELHKRLHDRKPFKCQLCDRFYAEKITLDRHVELVHSKVRKYSCDVCDKMFTRPDCVKIHKERKHNGDREKRKRERKNKSDKANVSTVKVEVEVDRNFDSVVPVFEIPQAGVKDDTKTFFSSLDDAHVVTGAEKAVLGI